MNEIDWLIIIIHDDECCTWIVVRFFLSQSSLFNPFAMNLDWPIICWQSNLFWFLNFRLAFSVFVLFSKRIFSFSFFFLAIIWTFFFFFILFKWVVFQEVKWVFASRTNGNCRTSSRVSSTEGPVLALRISSAAWTSQCLQTK